MATTLNAKIQILRTTAAAIASVTLESGRTVYLTDEDALVVGDGSTLGASLPRFNSGSFVWEENASVIRLAGADYDEDFVFGSPQLDDDNNTSHDKRVLFDKSEGAFRAGGCDGTQWDEANRGTFSFAANYNGTASGTSSSCFGARTTASGDGAAAFGSQTTASGDGAVAFGSQTIASGNYSIAAGQYCFGSYGTTTASGDGALAMGEGCLASAITCQAFGRQSESDKLCQQSIASGTFGGSSVTGDAQSSKMVARNSTANATPADLFIDGASAKITIPTDTAWEFSVRIVAAEQGMANTKKFHRTGLIANDGGSTSISTVDTIGTDRELGSPGAWSVAIAADDTGDALKITVTGEAATNIRWVANIEVTEVSYPAA